MNFKRVFTAAALVLTATVTMLSPLAVSAEDGYDADPAHYDLNCQYTDEGRYYSIHHYFGEYGKKLVVPAEIDGNSIKGIERDAFDCDHDVTEIVISDGIEYIEEDAFFHGHGPDKMTVTIPASVTQIDHNMLGEVYTFSRFDTNDSVIIELSNEIYYYANYKIYTMLGRHYTYYPEEQIFFDEAYMDIYNSLDWDRIRREGYQNLYDKSGRIVSFDEIGITTEMLDTLNIDTDFLIRGYSGTAAEQYANAHHMQFESLGAAPMTATATNNGITILIAGIALLIGIVLGVILGKAISKKRPDAA